MKIFDINRTFPKHDKKQFKSVEELLEYFKALGLQLTEKESE